MNFPGVGVASYVALWVVVVIQTLVLIEALRQIGVIRLRLGPEPGALLTDDGLERGTAAPAFAARECRTDEVFESEFRQGQLTLLLFLSTKCQTCRELAANLPRFSHDYAADARVITICSGPTVNDCRAFAHEFNLPFPVLFDRHQEIGQAYRMRVMPNATVVDADGLIRIHGVPNNVRHLVGLLEEEVTLMGGKEWLPVQEAEVMTHDGR